MERFIVTQTTEPVVLYKTGNEYRIAKADPTSPLVLGQKYVLVTTDRSGPVGAQGAQGPQGFQGSQGPQGFQGTQGPQGSQGPQGDVGPQGAQGAQGAQGFQGDTGSQGPQGFQGDTGPQGPQGFQGTQGPQGFQGDTGPQGAQGPQGPQGVQGADSIVPGPQGPQGDTGPQGSQGAQGAQGFQGMPGAQGAQGPQGSQGPQGDTGPQGFQGPQGPQGVTLPSGAYTYQPLIWTGTIWEGYNVIDLSTSGTVKSGTVSDYATFGNTKIGHVDSGFDASALYSNGNVYGTGTGTFVGGLVVKTVEIDTASSTTGKALIYNGTKYVPTDVSTDPMNDSKFTAIITMDVGV